MSLAIDGRDFSSLYFAGIMGSGRSAIAQFPAWSGQAISGSDRMALAEEMKDGIRKLEGCGCRLFPQDGSGITSRTEALLVSTAFEDDNPEMMSRSSSRGM